MSYHGPSFIAVPPGGDPGRPADDVAQAGARVTRSLLDELQEALGQERLVALATVVSGSGIGETVLLDGERVLAGEISSAPVKEAILAEASSLLEAHETRSFEVDAPSEGAEAVEVFFESFAPPPKLIVIGGVHVAIPLVDIANTLGFHTIVLDARSVYATRERFPHADELLVEWPADALEKMRLHESTYCVFLTHDAKLDNPGLVIALRSSARYVGALGSRKTHAKRVADLLERGLEDSEIERIHAPIGIKLGGNRPEEIAISIAAELVAARNGRA